jgi:hypothetical protein
MIDIVLKVIATPFIIIALMLHSFCISQIYEIFYANSWLFPNRWKRVDTWTYIILLIYFLTILGLAYFYSFWFLLALIPSAFVCFYIMAISYM